MSRQHHIDNLQDIRRELIGIRKQVKQFPEAQRLIRKAIGMLSEARIELGYDGT